MTELELDDIVKIYSIDDNVNIPALRGISITIEQGSFVSIIGPSGSGKTTLLNILTGKINQTSGSVKYGDTEFLSLTKTGKEDYIRKHVGHISQEPLQYLIPEVTCVENIIIYLKSRGDLVNKDRIRQYMETFRIDHLENSKTRNISMGEKVRLTLVMALSHEPEILFLDEPTGILGSEDTYNILNTLSELSKSEGVTVIAVTHDPRYQLASDLSYILIDGRIGSVQKPDIKDPDIETEEEKIEIDEIGLVDKSGFVKIPDKIIDELLIEERVEFTYNEEDKDFARISNPKEQQMLKSKSKDVSIEDVTEALKILIPKGTERKPDNNYKIDVNISQYGFTKQILNNIDLSITQKDVSVIMGPSGSGKSTLLGVISKELSNWKGSVNYHQNGDTLGEISDYIIYLPHEVYLHPNLTVKQQLYVLLDEVDKSSMNAIDIVLAYLEILDRSDMPVRKLSSGEFQRISFLVSILRARYFLLLDEPTAFLNSKLRDKLMDVLQVVSGIKNIGTIIATHDPYLLRSDHRKIELKDGEIHNIQKMDEETIEQIQIEFYKG